METRRFETQPKQGWVLFDINDLLYGVIQYLATYNNKETNENKKLYITDTSLKKNRKLIYNICSFNNRATYNNHLKKLVDKGLLEKFILKVEDKEYSCYGIIVNKDNSYQIIKREWLKYLIDTRNSSALKIYFFLLDRYSWKQKENKDCFFTNREIMQFMGYSESTRNSAVETLINNILNSFKREGVIKFEEVYEEYINRNGDTIPTPKKLLTFIAKNEEEIKIYKSVKI